MQAVDRLFRLLSVAALWLIAAMIYVAFFHQGGQFKLAAPASTPPPAAPPPAAPPTVQTHVTFPSKLAVTNAEGAPLRIVGEVTVAPPAKPAPPPRVKLTCRLTGSLTTAQPSFRMFGSEWKPDREWPMDAKLECETAELNQ